MERDIQVVVNPELYIIQIEHLTAELEKRDSEIARLSALLSYERSLREEAERKLGIQPTEAPMPKKRKRREVTVETNTYSEFKSDGKRKARPADPIRSYSDFKAIQQYFLDKGNIRDWTMWTIGVAFGLRISDLLSLRFCHVLEADKHTFRPRIQIYEQKTGKSNNCLITPAVTDALTKYLDSLGWIFDMDGFLFPSRKTKGKMYEEYGWKILSDAGKALQLPIVIGSHTIRKSFANIAACVDKSCLDMNSITKIQGLLNHGDQKVTMKYLGSYQAMFDRARLAVSDFILGKTDVDELIAGNLHTIDDVFERLELLWKTMEEKEDFDEETTG